MLRCRFLIVGAAFWLGLVCGCGEGNPLGRKPISGTVTLNGAPVAHYTRAG